MGLDIFFSEDIRNALLAADQASTATATARVCAAVGQADGLVLRAYLEGYRAALVTVALAFGLSPACLKPMVSNRVHQVEGFVTKDRVCYNEAGGDER